MPPNVDGRYTKTEGQILVMVHYKGLEQAGILAWISYRRAIVRLGSVPEIGEEVTLKAELLPNATFEVTGVVKSISDIPEFEGAREMEVRFIKLYPSSLAVLQTYLDTQMERRRDPRVHVELPVQIPHEQGGKSGATVNLSRGGMFVRTEIPVPVGTRITLRMDLGEEFGGEVLVEGVVAYTLPLTKAIHLGKSPGLGIRFEKFLNGGEERFKKFVESLEFELVPDPKILGEAATEEDLEGVQKTTKKEKKDET